jgi:hypothetical protein
MYIKAGHVCYLCPDCFYFMACTPDKILMEHRCHRLMQKPKLASRLELKDDGFEAEGSIAECGACQDGIIHTKHD